MKKKILSRLYLFVLVFGASQIWMPNLQAQIVVNGHNPSRWGVASGPRNSLSLSYGNVIWIDGKNKSLPGYSAPLAVFHEEDNAFNVDRYNASYGVVAGLERQLSTYFALRLGVSFGRMYTGMAVRSDLITNDKSSIGQAGFYGRYSLTRNLKHRFQFQLLGGPELIYAHKYVQVNDYVLNESSSGRDYMHDVTVIEGAVVAGLGLSFRLSERFALFSDALGGISLPGQSLKVTNSGLGLKYAW